MDETIFWTLIEETHKSSNGTIDDQVKHLLKRLSELEAETIYAFDRIFCHMRYISFRADLWDAASIIACGCSEDVFEEFRGWLIAQGKTIFESALNNPDMLAEIIPSDGREEALNGRLIDVAASPYWEKTGQDMPLFGYDKPLGLVGEFVKNTDYPVKFPRLFAKFGDCNDYWNS